MTWLQWGSFACVSSAGWLQPTSLWHGGACGPQALLLGNCTKQDQVCSLQGFGFSTDRASYLFTNAMFSLAWKNQCKYGENLHGLSFHHLIITLLLQSLFLF